MIGNINQITGATYTVASTITIGTTDTEVRTLALNVIAGTDAVLSVTPVAAIATDSAPALIQGQVLTDGVVSLFFSNQQNTGSITIAADTVYRVIIGRFDNFIGDGL